MVFTLHLRVLQRYQNKRGILSFSSPNDTCNGHRLFNSRYELRLHVKEITFHLQRVNNIHFVIFFSSWFRASFQLRFYVFNHLYLLSKKFLTFKLLRYFVSQNFVNLLMYHYPLLSEVHILTHNFVSSFQLILVFHSMTCTGGCGYSF